ncbi:hypothetical protein [Parachlamydia sp. AcF125]|uniref:hypothetical protein n=1 Tax=Parachlamydia sp. AcF125 TaxID=2795736 RepID=UPI001BD8EBA7|nr:hypothetical protein [Parachlamydia sp. AcF125]MBS4167473.1 hypothetical protein [Parachlamydia sp. AcF125]
MLKKIVPLLLLWIGCFLPSCSRQILTVQTEYLCHENLASYHVRTPDPLLENPPIGQRLLISWQLPPSIRDTQDLTLHIELLFRDHTKETKVVPIQQKTGTYAYALLNADYSNKKGILTYKVQLALNNQILEEWRHQLWVELITLDEDKENKKSVRDFSF